MLFGKNAGIEAGRCRLKDLAVVDSGLANAAHLLWICESFPTIRSRVAALVGVVTDSLYDKTYVHFKNFCAVLRKDELDAKKCGGGKIFEFYDRKFDCERVFGDSSVSFVSASSTVDAAPPNEEVSKLISKGVARFAQCCISLPTPPTTPISRDSRRNLRARVLNDAKRKVISDLRQKVRMLRVEIALLKRPCVPIPPKMSDGNRKELDRMRREVELLEEENLSLRDRVDELHNQNRIVTKINGKYTPQFHHLVIQLIALGIPDARICEVIRVVTAFVNCSLSDYPALSTIRNDAIALLGLTLQQAKEVIEEVVGGNDLNLMSDETTKRRHKMQTYLVNLERDESGSKVFCLGIPEVHAKTASESLEALKRRVNRIELMTSGTASGECLRKLISSISSCMSDRASTQVKFNKLLEGFKREILPTIRDDWEVLTPSEREALCGVHSLYCQLHIAASIADVFMRVMGEMEGASGEECTLLWVLKVFASHFSDRGSGKFQQLSKWLVFLDEKGMDRVHCILPSFDGQRFCIAFAIAARIFFLREFLVEYVNRFCTDNETLGKAKDALSSPLIVSQLKAASLIDSYVSAPLIRMSEHTKHVCDTSIYVGEMIEYLTISESDPTRMHSLTPPSISVGQQTTLFDLDSPYLRCTVASSQSADDSRCIAVVCSEIRLFLEVQFADFLPGGCYHSPSQSLLDSLRNAPSTSRAAERTFGMMDWLFVKSPNCRMVRREGVVMSKMNGTMTWLASMSLDVQAKVLQSALGMRRKLVKASEEEKVELARKIREDMLEKEEEAKKKLQRAFERQSAIATVIATETGYWRTVEAMDLALEDIRNKGEKIRALTFQIQYRKTTLKQPPPRPGIFVIRPKGIPVTVERLRDTVKELIDADLTASSGKRTAPNWKGRRIERLVRSKSGMYTLVEGVVKEIDEVHGVLYVTFAYDDGESDTILLEEFEEELEADNAKFLGKKCKK